MENERLRREKEALERQAKQPVQEVLKEVSAGEASAALVGAGSAVIASEKEYYKGKNEEIEQLIEQVLKQQQTNDQSTGN